MLGHVCVRREAGCSAKVCTRAIAVQQVFHRGAVRVAKKRFHSSPMQPSWPAWCNFCESRNRGRIRGGRHGLTKPTEGGEDEEEAHTLWEMPDADDAGVVSPSPG